MNFKTKWSDNQGFTLLEVMMALSITSLCFILLSAGITQIKSFKTGVQEDKQIEWHLFINQMEHYLEGSKFVSSTGNSLLVEEIVDGKHQRVQYIKTTNFFARRLNNGTQPLLTNISRVEFQNEGQALKVTGTFYNGEKYQAKVQVNSWSGESDEK